MTIGQKLHQALTSAESLTADLKSFALDTQNQSAKQLYTELASSMENVTNQLRGRVNQAEAEEPQYKVFKNQG